MPLKLKKLQGKTLRKTYKLIYGSLLDRPKTIALDVSSRCNLRCKMCSLPTQSKKGDMDMEIFDRLLKVFRTVATVELYSSGEPLMNKNLVKMLEKIKKVAPLTSVEFYTNGILLNEDIAVDLVEKGLDRITFSLDGAEAKTYEKIRQGANFNKVLVNIKLLQETKRNLNKKSPSLSLAFVAMKDNISELPSLVKLAYDLNIFHINVNGLEPYSEDFENQILYHENNEKYREYFEQAIQRAREFGVCLLLPKLERSNMRSCVAHKLALISWDGYVRPCPAFSYPRPFYYFGQRLFHQEISFGNITQSDFYEIWYSQGYKKFRRRIKRDDFSSLCDNCLLSHGLICPI